MFSKAVLSFFITALITIIGCATPYDLKKTRPIISYSTTKSVKDAMKCIRDEWRKQQPMVYEEKTHSGYVVRHDDALPSATVAIVTIEEQGPEVKVEYFHRTNRLKLHDLEEAIIGCK